MITAQDRVYRWRAMASPISLHLPDLDDVLGHAVAQAVAADMEATEQALSRFRETAELVALNARVGQWTTVSDRLYKALSAARQARLRTGGLFDPRVLGRLEAYGYQGAPRLAPEPRALQGPWLLRRPRTREVLLLAPVDLGGIGKGLALRWAASIAEHVTGNLLLNAGGDLLAAGPGLEGEGWQIGVEDPQAPDSLKAALRVSTRQAVCTSSVANLRWIHQGEEVHHLIDPRSGRPGGEGLLAVTVVGRDPAWSEVLSKTLFLHGSGAIARAASGHAALWVGQGGEFRLTDEAKDFVFWLP